MINKDMTIMEALEQNRASATVFAGYGMGCIGCLAASGETIAEDVDELVNKLNETCK